MEGGVFFTTNITLVAPWHCNSARLGSALRLGAAEASVDRGQRGGAVGRWENLAAST